MQVPYRGYLPDRPLDPPDPPEYEYEEDAEDIGEGNNHYEKYGYKL